MRRLAVAAAVAVLAIAGATTATLLTQAEAATSSLATCEQSVSEALLSNRIVAASQSYRKDNPSEYTRVRAFLDGGVRPTGSLTHMGLHLVYLEDTCRGLAVPPPTTTTTTQPTTTTTTTTTTPPPPNSLPPPAAGYFPNLLPPGASLPNDCASRVQRSTWEPRPDNTKRNTTTVNAQAVHDSFSSRLRATEGTYDPRWDTFLLARVDGQFTGTTDEIFQWAACKWGLPDNVVRAVATQESTWYQYLTYPSNRCVSTYGCGDFFGSTNAASATYCNHIATFGYDYQPNYSPGQCPQTFSILGIKSYWDPSWGFNWAGNQNGTFPFNRNSTAFAADYYASQMRGCYNGWILHSGAQANDLWGCVGMWFSGSWHDAAANQYASQVQVHLNGRRWLQSGWPNDKPGCHATYGCPGPDGLP